ncbi:response regulator transcription factor [Alteromonas confluentis]|nr:response regulator [Alteromonas confluentis]
MKKTVLIIDDDVRLSEVLSRRFKAKTDYLVHCYSSASEALAHEPQSVFAVFLDMMLEDEIGLDFITQLKTHFSPEHLIIMTGYASIPTTVQAIKKGATDYLSKPVTFQALLQRLEGAQPNHEQTEPHLPMTPAQAEWEHIQRALHDNNNNISATAKALGMHRRTLQRKLQKLSPS